MINHNQYIQRPTSNILTPTTNINYVQGEAGAKAYPIANGYTMFLMDAEDQKFYIKQCDAMGMPSMRKFRFEEEKDPVPEKNEYVTKADFEKFEDKIMKLLQPKKETKLKGGESDA